VASDVQHGYHSFQAWRRGASVCAYEPDAEARGAAEFIGRHIEMEDVEFFSEPPPDGFQADVVLYLSVHHQHDPDYRTLEAAVRRLKTMASEALFIELILPPMFGAGVDVDAAVGGKVLRTYRHRVRGERRIYLCDSCS